MRSPLAPPELNGGGSSETEMLTLLLDWWETVQQETFQWSAGGKLGTPFQTTSSNPMHLDPFPRKLVSYAPSSNCRFLICKETVQHLKILTTKHFYAVTSPFQQLSKWVELLSTFTSSRLPQMIAVIFQPVMWVRLFHETEAEAQCSRPRQGS